MLSKTLIMLSKKILLLAFPTALLLEHVAAIQWWVFASITLIIIDFILGIIKAKKLKQTITSEGFRRTTSKFVSYIAAIVGAHIVEQIFFIHSPYDFLHESHLTYLVSAFICLTELKSNFENIAIITGTDLRSIISNILRKGEK